MSTFYHDTIVGIATAPGEAGVSIIRISGEDSLRIGEILFKAKNGKQFAHLKSRYLHYGTILDGMKEIDEALLCIMRKPKSFTSEDVVEIHCHGGNFLTRKIVELALDKGARLSRAGEFTQRAFLNGRIDLTQAEAVNDIIQARTGLGVEMVVNQLKGKLYRKIISLKEKVAWILALVNAAIDFPEEDVVFSHHKEIFEKIEMVEGDLNELILSATTGIIVRDGYKVVLVGEPNVGKSSIMNLLLGESRAIVTKVPGTTRDTIEESLVIEGIPVSLTDTAGIREAVDTVEQEGITRTLHAMEQADLILWVIDMNSPSFEIPIPDHAQEIKTPILVVGNKLDLVEQESLVLPKPWKKLDCITISAKNNTAFDLLRNEIHACLSGNTERVVEDTMLTNLRQKKAAEHALQSLIQAKGSLQKNLGEELITVDLANTLHALGDIVGDTTPEEMLNMIFSQFCIGK